MMRLLGFFCALIVCKGADLDASRLRTGTFHYRTLVDGKPAGESEIKIRKSGDNYVFSNAVGGAFSQSWEAIATGAFVPVSAKLIFGAGDKAEPKFDLAYHGARVTGLVYNKSGYRKIDDAVVADTVDQRIDWAVVMSLKDYRPGVESKFHVYDPGTGNSRVTVKIGQAESASVPAGTFQTFRVVYRIEKNGGTEEYRLLVTKDLPRMMVKEEFPNGAVTELVDSTPDSQIK